jgi:hypothetical protein
MKDKWNVKNKKGCLKIHIAVNMKSKKNLSMKVTDVKHVHDSKVLPELVNAIIKLDKKITIVELFADDGAYEGNYIFRYLGDNRILHCIQVRKNTKVRWKKEHILRNLTVLAQRNDLKWKYSISYGKRWIVETVFSCLKRMFGEYIYSVKLQYMIQEMMLKASLYNKLISV